MAETSQAGIFALGTPSHAYLEFDAHEGAGPRLVTAIASLHEPRTTMGGVNLVTGFRPELWRAVAPDDAPPDLQGFDVDVVGAEGYRMPATQHDAVLWLSGSAYDVVFETARAAIAALHDVATVGGGDPRCSWDSAPTSGGSARCWRTWLGSRTGFVTR
jgi:putative iron-dependent peroxidase